MSRRWLILAFVAALVVAGGLTMRAIHEARDWHPPPGLDPEAPLEGWMTLRLIAHVHGDDPQRLALALGYDPDAPPRRKTLDEIAAEQGLPVSDVIARLTAALEARP